MQQAHLVAPDQLTSLVVGCARTLGAVDTAMYLVDYEQAVLVPVHGSDAGGRPARRVDATLAGAAFRRVTPQLSQAGGVPRLFVPLLDGVDRVGVLEYVLEGADPEPLQVRMLAQYAHLVAELVVATAKYADVYEWTRRRLPMLLAAELRTSCCRRSPSARTAWSSAACSPRRTRAAATPSTTPSTAASRTSRSWTRWGAGWVRRRSRRWPSAYRNVRRAGLDLEHTTLAVDEVLAAEHGGERFVPALLGQLDLDTGRSRWVSCGHPAPLLLRDGKVVGALETEPGQPLGLLDLGGGAAPPVATDDLQPGDRLLLFTDGVDEARGRDGSSLGCTGSPSSWPGRLRAGSRRRR